MTQWVNVGGTWRKVVGEYTRVAGVWRRSAASFVNVGAGTPRFYTTTPTMQFLTSVEDSANRSSYTFNNISLGAEDPNRRIFAFVTTDYGPTGNLDLTQTWNVGGVNYSTTLVSNALQPGFYIDPAFTYYIDRHTSSISSVIPTGATGNYTLSISTNGAISYGVSVSFYALYDFVSYTAAVSKSGQTGATITVSNVTPGTKYIGYTINRSASYPTLTGSSLSGTLVDTYGRSLGSSAIYSSIYTFSHNGSNIISSETFTSNGTGNAGDSRIVLFQYR